MFSRHILLKPFWKAGRFVLNIPKLLLKHEHLPFSIKYSCSQNKLSAVVRFRLIIQALYFFQVEPEKLDMVSVFFSDIVSYTNLCSSMPADKVKI